MQNTQFKNLQYILHAYFHQDRDMESDGTVEGVIAAFKRAEREELQHNVAIEIREYLGAHQNDTELTRHFFETFEPEIVEGSDYGTVRQFLTKVADLLSTPGRSTRAI